MQAVDKVGYPQLSAAETVEALGLFLDKCEYRSDIYWPKSYQVNVTRTGDELHFQVMTLPAKDYVGGLKVTTVDGNRKVTLDLSPRVAMEKKKRIDHIKTALRRMIVTVAYRDYWLEKNTQQSEGENV